MQELILSWRATWCVLRRLTGELFITMEQHGGPGSCSELWSMILLYGDH